MYSRMKIKLCYRTLLIFIAVLIGVKAIDSSKPKIKNWIIVNCCVRRVDGFGALQRAGNAENRYAGTFEWAYKRHPEIK